jgi:hypothetical protein
MVKIISLHEDFIRRTTIYIGFCTSAGLGKFTNYNHPESAYYNCGGYFYEGGVSKNDVKASRTGDVIECEADLLAGRLRWSKSNNTLKDELIKECALPQ